MERAELRPLLPFHHTAGRHSHGELERHVQERRTRDHLRRAAAKPTTRAAYRGQVRRVAGGGRRVGPPDARLRAHQLKCLLTSAVISNIETCFLPPKTFFRLSSALIIRLFCWSCRPWALM